MISKSNKIDIAYVYAALALVLFGRIADMYSLGALKNLRFLAPVLLIPYTLFALRETRDYRRELRPFLMRLIGLYLLVAFYTFLSNTFYYSTGFTYRNVVNIILAFSPLLIANSVARISSMEEVDRFIRFLFIGFVLIYVLELAKNGISLSGILAVFQANIITDSDYDTESGVSLVLGFFALYYLYRGKYRWMIAACFLTLLSAKRIAIFGLLLSVCLYIVYPVLERKISANRKFFTLMLVALCLLLANFWQLVITGQLNEVVEEYTGLNVNRFFMGRIGRFEVFFNYLKEENLPGLGYGLGYAENVLYYKASYETSFHNDFYRLYIEFGGILFSAWLFIHFYYNLTNRLATSVLCLLFIMMQTDNVFMYDRVMICYFLIYIYAVKRAAAERQPVRGRRGYGHGLRIPAFHSLGQPVLNGVSKKGHSDVEGNPGFIS